jgi:hypothetical protein
MKFFLSNRLFGLKYFAVKNRVENFRHFFPRMAGHGSKFVAARALIIPKPLAKYKLRCERISLNFFQKGVILGRVVES